MNSTIAILLALCFVMSIAGLFLLVWVMASGQFTFRGFNAKVIFAEGEEGNIEEPAADKTNQQALQTSRNNIAERYGEPSKQQTSREELEQRKIADQSSRLPVQTFLLSAVFWLLIGSFLGLIVSLKLHLPDWLVSNAALTFGRLRPMHVNAIAYGWASMAGLGIGIWLLPRLLKTELVGGTYAVAGAVIWNIAMLVGMLGLMMGWTEGLEWLEYPWQLDSLLVIAVALTIVPLLLTLKNRTVDHLYVSVWYLGATMVWFPVLFIVANFPGIHFGVEQAITNWWFGHNVLGLWVTPAGLAAAYYFIPKVLGRPIFSYHLSLLGFWATALFYSQVGIHHLIGGPVPTWLVTLSIVQSIMMLVPVVGITINYTFTMAGHWRTMKYSPTLRFVVIGAMMYIASSVQGSLEALRSINAVTHFTHYTVAHAHLGMYGFFTMIMFGSIYFVAPRLFNRDWPMPKLISLHFWLVVIGFSIYFIGLTIGGWLQGLAMLDISTSFMESVQLTIPYLKARSVGGSLMVLGHLVFAYHFFIVWLGGVPEIKTEQKSSINTLSEVGA